MTRSKRFCICNNLGMGSFGVVLLILFALLAAVGIGALLGYYTSGGGLGGVRKVFEPPFDGRRTVRILMLGEDNTGLAEDRRGLSDTIILTSVDLDNKHVAAISIPRDTRVDLGEYGTCKINAAHVHGGPMLTAQVVGELTGVQPDYYVKTNIEGFKELVDILGGVQIYVEKNMNYDDNWGKLHIHLKKGMQRLDGEKAMQYVRFRHDTFGDITRIQRQQKFLKALAEKALAPENLPKLPRTIRAVLRNVDTNLGPRDAISLARFFSKLDMERVKTETIPGVPETIGGASYWIADPVATAEIVKQLFFPPMPALPTVEVLNGSGIVGAAQKVGNALSQHGYDVLYIENADSNKYTSSEVIVHNPEALDIEQIADIMNTDTIKKEENPSAKADVTVIVGKDCLIIGSGG